MTTTPGTQGQASMPPPIPADLAPPQLTENAQVVLRRRYLERDARGQPIETPQQMLWRVAWHVAQAERPHAGDIEATARRFYDMMARLEFLPNSPTLMNAGRPLGQLAACFVLPIDDSLESIFDTLKHAALVHQSGGGTGFDLSRIRPKGDPVQSTHGVASGPLSFLHIYNAATEEIRQGGTRRGANMGILRIDHPDILQFIQAKDRPDQLTNFNVSIAITDDFMEALRHDTSYSLIHPGTGEAVGALDAKTVFEAITQSAWKTGEPGLFFVDRANDTNPVQHAETIAASNPCGEQALAPYDSCTLGSIDLSRHIRDNEGEASIDWNKLIATTTLAVRFLDNVIDVTKPPLPEIATKTKANRRIGLGIMGLARALMRLGIPYASDEGRATAGRIMQTIQQAAHEASARLATERGVFPNYPGSRWEQDDTPMRNAACTTVAPTGTLSMIAETSGGCEPEFSLVCVKRCLDGTTLPYVVPELEATARREGWWADDLLERIAKNSGNARGLDDIPLRWQQVFATSNDIAPEDHVRMQATCQAHVDNAVSKTVNLPPDATPDDVGRIYRLADALQCKGITVYRQGTRPDQVLRAGTQADRNASSSSDNAHTMPEDRACDACDIILRAPEAATESPRRTPTSRAAQGANAAPAGVTDASGIRPRARPDVTAGWTHRIETGCGTLFVTVNEDQYGPAEVIAVLGRANGHTQGHIEATSQMVSLALRCGVDVETIVSTLGGIRCGPPVFGEDGRPVHGCADAIAHALERQMLGPDGPTHAVFQQSPLHRFGSDGATLTHPSSKHGDPAAPVDGSGQD